jgi:hypothetical protein
MGPVGESTRRALGLPVDHVETVSERRHVLPPGREFEQRYLTRERPDTVEQPAVLHQQSWEIDGGSLTLEIRSSRSLPASAFMQIGLVMSEIEKLKDLLTEGAESGKKTE